MQKEDSQRRRRLVRRLTTLSVLSGLLFPGLVEAQEDDGLNHSVVFGGGVFVGYTFGPRDGVEWGFEGFATHRFNRPLCTSERRTGVGGSLQVGLNGLGDLRLTLAAHGGGELLRPLAGLSGELGVTGRFSGDRERFGIHTGLLAETLLLFGALRHQWILDDTWVGGGVRFPGTYGLPGFCAVGRPLRATGGVLAVAPPAVRAGSVRAEDLGQECVEAAGREWARDAQLECASVPAFLQLAQDLLEQGAPLGLVERALDAADDEVRHARLCARLASRHLRLRIRPALPPGALRTPLAGGDGLRRLATESWLDGCLGEGIAAAHAAHAARLATDAEAATAQRRIARDERRHAALAWDVLAWACGRGGDGVRDAVLALARVEHAPAGANLAPSGLESHGRLGPAALERIAREHVVLARRRLTPALRAAAPTAC